MEPMWNCLMCVHMGSMCDKDGFMWFRMDPACFHTPHRADKKVAKLSLSQEFLNYLGLILSQFLISYGFLRRILAMHTQVVSVSQHAGWFGAPCCRSTPDQFFPGIFHDFQQIFADFPWISMGFSWIFDEFP